MITDDLVVKPRTRTRKKSLANKTISMKSILKGGVLCIETYLTVNLTLIIQYVIKKTIMNPSWIQEYK